jgi:hypothetical protein
MKSFTFLYSHCSWDIKTHKIIFTCADLYVITRRTFKVVQIWPGQTVTCLHTNSPGHIWTTLYSDVHGPADSHAVQKSVTRLHLLCQLSSSESRNIITFRDIYLDCSITPPFLPCTLVSCRLEEIRCSEPATVGAILPCVIYIYISRCN